MRFDQLAPTALTIISDPARQYALGQTLKEAGFKVQNAKSGADGLGMAKEMPDVILLDLLLPDISGFEVCCRLKAHAATAAIPVLHLSDAPHESCLGASDEPFLTHPVDAADLLASVGRLLRVRRTQRQFDLFLEAAPDAVVIVDVDGKIHRVNAQAEAMFGYRRNELVGRKVEILMPERSRDGHVGQLADFVKCPSIRPMERAQDLWGLRKDGTEFPIEVGLCPLPDHEEVLVASIVRDVTERRRLEHELREADRRKNEFLATLAHELRNPLAPIRNAMQFFHIRGPAVPEVQWAAGIIDRQVQRMTRLVDDLLDISRISCNKLEISKERVELASVVQGAVETSRPLIEECGQELTVNLPPGPITLDADPTRLAQVISNLLNNAAKYMDKGGRIDLTVERIGSDVVMSIRDTGIGIPADKLATVFEMFSQVESALGWSQGGMGIGLSLVKRLVEMHGGCVEAKSDGVGKGSEFVVRLPVVVEAARALEAGEWDEPAAPKSSLTILIVDDNRDAANSLAMLLRIMGNDTRTAYDGQEGMDMAEKFRPDVALLDISLPKLNGYQMCRRIREQPWGIGIVLIAVTGRGQDEDRRRSQEAGFDHHMVKPVDPKALMNLLAELDLAKT